MRLLHELNEAGQAVVMVTHDPRLASQAARIVRLEAGRVVSDAPPAQRMAS
jgi:ABC-type lipoprotein export system ATPase subunit